MNILYTITSYPPSMGGAQLYLHEIARRLEPKHNVAVFSFFNTNRTDWLLGTTLRTPFAENEYIYENVKVKQIAFTREEKLRMRPYVFTYYLNKTHNINVLAKLIEKKLFINDFKIDLIHNIRVGREPLSYASYNLAKKLNVPFVFTPLHHPRWSHPFFKEYHRLYRAADGLLALTPHEKENYRKLGVKKDNVYITGTGTVLSDQSDSEAFKKRHNLTGKVILFIGQGYKYKGMQQLLKAARIVLNRKEDVNFVFIGPHTRYSKKLFKRYSCDKIIHLGKVDLQTKTDALAACDIFCLPSSQESFGAVFLEAWAFKKPVIGLDIPQVECLIDHGSNGYLASEDPGDIAYKIINLLDNPGLRAKFGEAGNRKLVDNFTWDVLCDNTEKVYEELIEKLKEKSYGKHN